jgi:hypothetical protein
VLCCAVYLGVHTYLLPTPDHNVQTPPPPPNNGPTDERMSAPPGADQPRTPTRDVMLVTVVPWLLRSTVRPAFLAAQPLHASQAFSKLVCSDLQCLVRLVKRGAAMRCVRWGDAIDRVMSIVVGEIGVGRHLALAWNIGFRACW